MYIYTYIYIYIYTRPTASGKPTNRRSFPPKDAGKHRYASKVAYIYIYIYMHIHSYIHTYIHFQRITGLGLQMQEQEKVFSLGLF